MSPTTRWCPTPEQLMILEEMYRGGIRSPSATQIQMITAHLSNYGRVEGKNVFYWFQNHKARDRQKLRRKLSKQFQLHHHHQLKQHHINHHLLHYLSSAQPLPPPSMTTSSPVSALQHRGLYNAATFLPPQIHGGLGGAGHVENTLSQIINNNNMNSNNVSNKVFESSDIDDEEKKKMEMEIRKYKQNQADWMMMMMMEVPYCATTKPIKTLELFPLTATNLKE